LCFAISNCSRSPCVCQRDKMEKECIVCKSDVNAWSNKQEHRKIQIESRASLQMNYSIRGVYIGEDLSPIVLILFSNQRQYGLNIKTPNKSTPVHSTSPHFLPPN
jgi:hypothetical protein